MPIRFESPVWLLLALVLIPAAVIALRWFVTMTRLRRWSAIAARGLLLLALAALLAGAVTVRRTNRLAVVVVLDVSDSIRLFADEMQTESGRAGLIEVVRDRLDGLDERRGAEDLLGVVVFDGRSLAIATPTRAVVGGRPLDISMRPGTNIEEAIRYAAALVPPDAAGRLVLISDGNETEGNAAQGASELTSRLENRAGGRSGVPVDVVPVTYRVRDEVIVERVETPPTAPAGSVIPVRVHLLAASPAEGVLRLTRNGAPLPIGADGALGKPLRLAPGRQVEVLDVELDAGRVHELEAVWEPGMETGPDGNARLVGDRRVENNRAGAITITPGRGEVLIVDGVGRGASSGGGATLARTLRQAGLEVTMVSPEAMPSDLIALQRYDLIVMQNVPADVVPSRAQQALAAHVEQIGAGLVMVGGPDSFAPGGWRGSPIEPLLPVNMEVPDDLVIPTAAVMLVLDNSGSMGFGVMGSLRSKQEIANESAALAISTLDERDLVGVIAFNSSTRTVIPLSPNTDPERSADRIRSISAGGGTQMGPALLEAEQQLVGASAEIKHLIVLSDGQSQDAERLPFIAERFGNLGIRVTTISVGEEADLDTMAAIAREGGGEHYVAVNPDVLPRIFIKAVRIVRTPMVRESPFVPLVLATGSPLVEGLGELPPLGGLVLTQARPDATITTAMVTAEGEPVFAHWQVGLGNVAAFTSDARSDRWATRWVDWPGYAQFWVRLARTLSRPTDQGPYALRIRQQDGAVVLELEAADEDGAPIDYLRIPATVYGPDGEAIETRLDQVGPGKYEATVPVPGLGRTVAVVRPSLASRALPPVVGGVTVDSDAEYRRLRSDEALLADVASITGGRMLTLGDVNESVFDRTGIPGRITSSPLFLPLILASLTLFLLDVATRRVAWDRFVSREFGADLRRSAAEATRSRTEQARRSLAELKAGRERSAVPSERGDHLDDSEASALVDRARDRREREEATRLRKIREDMLGDVRTQKPESEGDRTAAESEPPISGTGGLLEAKRRARERFEREQGEDS